MSSPQIINLDVVVIGGGFAGVYCARELRKQLGAEAEGRVGIISEQNHLVFQPMLPEVAGASISPRHVVNPIRIMCRGIEVYKGIVKAIDPVKKTVRFDAGSFSPNVIVNYKHLVIGLGSEIDLSRVPGMSEHAFLMHNVGDAMKLRAATINRFEEANIVDNPEVRKRLLTFVIVGGGYSGVETAGQILDMFHGMHKFYSKVSDKDFKVILVHSKDHILPTLNKRLGKYAEKVLRERGLEFILEKRVKAVTANNVYLDDGSSISSATVISTVGNAPNKTLVKLCQDFGIPEERGRIITDSYLSVKEHDGLWAAGDCAAVPHVEEGYCPPTAQFAMRQGILLGKNIAAKLKNKDLKPFTFKGLGELATIGHRTAVADVMGFQFSGFMAWWMWRTVYLMKLPGLDRKIRIMIDWSFDLFFPRDITLLNPRYTTMLREMYLEKGNVLFSSGEPAFSFYVVKAGRIEIRDDDKIVKVIEAGGYFGERALLEDNIWRYTAIAVESTRLIALGAEAFKPLVEGSISLLRMFKKSARQYSSESEIGKRIERLPEEMLNMPVSMLMHTDTVTIRRTDKVTDVIDLLRRHRHSVYPVVDENKKLLGVMNREDFYDFIKEPGIERDTTLEALDVSFLPVVESTSTVKAMIEALVRNGGSKLLVVDSDSRLEGIVTVMDLIDMSNSMEEPSALQKAD